MPPPDHLGVQTEALSLDVCKTVETKICQGNHLDVQFSIAPLAISDARDQPFSQRMQGRCSWKFALQLLAHRLQPKLRIR